MSAINSKTGLTSFHLKLIAIITMTIDHVGAALFPGVNIGGFEYLRIIGRLAFPIFCFLIVEGFVHTRNVKKYMLRLFVFVFISEIPFDLLFNTTGNLFAMQNVFGTLFLGLVMIYAIDEVYKKMGRDNSNSSTAVLIILLAAAIVAYFTRVDYSVLGIAYMAVFYLYQGKNLHIFVSLIVLNILFCGVNDIQMFSALAVPIIACYNGKLGPKVKYLFYVYYPLHLGIIMGIYVWINGRMPTNYIRW